MTYFTLKHTSVFVFSVQAKIEHDAVSPYQVRKTSINDVYMFLFQLKSSTLNHLKEDTSMLLNYDTLYLNSTPSFFAAGLRDGVLINHNNEPSTRPGRSEAATNISPQEASC